MIIKKVAVSLQCQQETISLTIIKTTVMTTTATYNNVINKINDLNLVMDTMTLTRNGERTRHDIICGFRRFDDALAIINWLNADTMSNESAGINTANGIAILRSQIRYAGRDWHDEGNCWDGLTPHEYNEDNYYRADNTPDSDRDIDDVFAEARRNANDDELDILDNYEEKISYATRNLSKGEVVYYRAPWDGYDVVTVEESCAHYSYDNYERRVVIALPLDWDYYEEA